MREGRGAVVRARPRPALPARWRPGLPAAAPAGGTGPCPYRPARLTRAGPARRPEADGARLPRAPSSCRPSRSARAGGRCSISIACRCRPSWSEAWVDVPEAAVEHVLLQLPEPFRHASCWWALSASAACPTRRVARSPSRSSCASGSGCRVRCSVRPLKRWMAAERAPVDPAVFGAVQLVYVAAPSFGPGSTTRSPGAAASGTGSPTRSRSRRCCRRRLRHQRTTAQHSPRPGALTSWRPCCAHVSRARLHVREHLAGSGPGLRPRHGGADIDREALVATLGGM